MAEQMPQKRMTVSDVMKAVFAVLEVTPNAEGKTLSHTIGNKENGRKLFSELADVFRYDVTTGYLAALEIQHQKSDAPVEFKTKKEIDLFWEQTLMLLDMCYYRVVDIYKSNITEFSETLNTDAMMQCIEGRIKELALVLHFAERTGRGKDDLIEVDESERMLPDPRSWRRSSKYATLDLPRAVATILTPQERRKQDSRKATFTL
jgi:hypothetical protein